MFKHNKKCKGTARIIVCADGTQRYVCDKCCPQGLTITELLAKQLNTNEDEAIRIVSAMAHMLNISIEDAIKRVFANNK